MTDIVETKTLSLNELLTEGRFIIPRYQRDYSWTEEKLEDLWDDLQDLVKEPKNKQDPEKHYMGFLVLQHKEEADNTYFVVDGQQRLTSLSILILAVISKFKQIGDVKKLSEYEQVYIAKHPNTKPENIKLQLNKTNNYFYRDYLVPREVITNSQIKELLETNKNLYKAKLFFDTEISKAKLTTSSKLTEFVEAIVHNTIFSIIKVSDNSDTYKLFLTLNYRGISLATHDLLKNHLYSKIDVNHDLEDSSELDEIERIWEGIVDRVSVKRLTHFLKVDWNRRKKDFKRERELYKAISLDITSKSKVFPYVKNLLTSGELYIRLIEPTKSIIKSKYPNVVHDELKECLNCLYAFGVKSPIALLMTVLEKSNSIDFNKNDVLKIIQYINVITVRFNGIGRGQANRQEKAYCNLSYLIYNYKPYDLYKMFNEFYSNDDKFVQDFLAVNLTQKKRIKYIFETLKDYINNSQFYGDEENLIVGYLRNVENSKLRGYIKEHKSITNHAELFEKHRKFLAKIAKSKWCIDW